MIEECNKQKVLKKFVILLISCCFITLTVLILCSNSVLAYGAEVKSEINTVSETDEEDVMYLSDLDYITTNNWSYVSWGRIQKDRPPEGSVITLKIDGKNKTFLKGLGLHANAQITYDISELSGKYTRFIAKAGLDASRGSNGNGIWFRVSVSNDGENWTNLCEKSQVVKGDTSPINMDYDVTGYKYLRVIVNNNGNESADHGVLADAKLAVADYTDTDEPEYDKIHTLEYYDNILSGHDTEYNYENNYRLILEREFVNKFGYDEIVALSNLNKKTRNTLDWLLSKNDTLEQVIEVGELSSGASFINILSNLYSTYKASLSEENGYVYQKMMIAMAASYSSDSLLGPLAFGDQSPTYDYIERFETMKYLFDNNKFMVVKNNELMGEFVPNTWFKDYHIQLMRMVMREPMRNDELVWLNEYTHYRGGYSFYWFAYVSPNYNKPAYQSEENRETYTSRYILNDDRLGKYKVPYGDGIIRYWMALDTGGICWNASRFGQSMLRINGIPATGAYQPGHELYIGYYQDENGNGYWSTRYGNWEGAGSTWGGGMRCKYLFNWANKYFTDQHISGGKGATSTGYLYLGQDNLNHLEAYQKSVYYNLTANSYTDNNKKLEAYFKSLEVNDLNLDTYDSIINLYKTMSVKNEGGTITSSDWRALAEKINSAYAHHPVALYDLFKVIRPYLEGEDRVEIDAIEKETLESASTFQSSNRGEHAEAVRTHARQLLNKTQADPVSFSFDGENAGKIVRNPEYDIGIRYSLDGGVTFSEYSSEDMITLSKEEIASINTENDIIVSFMGLSRTFTIDITKGTMPTNLYNNDLENRIINVQDTMEWRFNDGDEWISYKDEVPDLTGNKTVEVRVGCTGTKVTSDSVRYTFTEDNQPDTEKYIPISRLSVHSVSSQEAGRGEGAINAIDGNLKTIWHSNWDGSDSDRYIVIKLDSEVFLSALQYYPRQDASNGRIRSAKVSISTDGENWTDLVTETDWANNGEPKKLSFATPRKARYVKLTANSYYGDGRSFVSAAMINLFEDTTANLIPNFSFDGINAGRIFFEGEANSLVWRYSLDGGVTWNFGSGSSYKLSDDEISRINEQNKIKIQIIVNGQGSQKTINIQKEGLPNINPYLNDWENRLIGIGGDISKLEWKIEGSSNGWTSYEEQEPVVLGTNKLLVRTKAHDVYAASNAREYNFNEDNQPNTRKYIPIEHLSVHQVSSEATGAGQNGDAIHAIDGDARTRWHSSYDGSDRRKFIVIKLDKPRYLTAVEYMPLGQRNGKIQEARIEVSMDGENWVTVKSSTGWRYMQESDDSDKSADFNATQGQYIRITGTTTQVQATQRDKSFIVARMFRLYEDRTKEPEPVVPTAEIEYSTTELTNQDVTATLVNSSTDITVTNNGGNTAHTFTENGEFIFEFEDAAGNRGTAVAKVDWIDKVVPKATISYSTTGPTNQDVIATITFDEKNVVVKDGNTHTFTSNGEYTFEFEDEAGNTGTAKAEVTWIDKVMPRATITYSTENMTNQNVIATVSFDKENVTILNNDGNNTYTFTENGEFEFEFRGPAGNAGKVTAKVDWIDKVVPTATIGYSTTELTNQDVTATITFNEENVTILNNDGNDTYTFADNGEFTFEFEDAVGNRGTAIAKVGWIDKIPPKATITYDITEPTNQPVTATITFDKGNVTVEGGNTHTFTENGRYIFNFIGPVGNRGVALAEVDWIEAEVPVATITYDITSLTNHDVVATISFNKEDVTILNNDGNNSYTFTENGEFEFEFRGSVGSAGKAVAKVDWIDKVVPKATISYNTMNPTNQSVVATVTVDKENVIVKNGNTHTFVENGEYIFEFEDTAGNSGTAKAVVSWIDKVVPKAIITYSINELTNKDIIATITFDEENVIVKDGATHTFTENGKYTFEFADKAGNRGTAKAEVTWIDKVAPKATITYSTTNPTNQDVVATITFDKENVVVTGGNAHTFTDNGEYTFEFEDEIGNSGTAKAVVNWIDKVMPRATITYSTTNMTNQDVVATISFDKENVRILNNDGNNTYTFTENGEFEFEFRGPAGNAGKVTAKVDWIDKVVPKATISYSTMNPTNQPVVATVTFDKKNVTVKDGNTHTFTENGEYTFEFVGPSGNRGTAVARVDWIDKTLPEATISYNITSLTNQDVVATISFDKKDVRILNNDGNNTYTFTDNGEFEFEFVGPAGNRGTVIAKVNWIDKTAPKATIAYDIVNLTNKDVTATIKFDKENVTVKNGNTHIFTENGEYTFEFEDTAGNTGTAKAVVSWIDKIPPVATISYNVTESTIQNIIATVTFDEENVVVKDGNTHIFTDNGEYTFEFEDEAGNKGTAKAKVTWIDRIAPKATIIYNTTEPTNQDVIATITFDKENVVVTGGNTHTFTDNGEYTFEFEDELGNSGTAKAVVSWIDKVMPRATITYSTTNMTNQDVVAMISFDKENVRILNNDGNNTYTFTENGEFEFEFRGPAGNAGKVTAKVDWIDKVVPKPTITYSITNITNQDVVATISFDKENVTVKGGNTHTFTENGEYTFEFVGPSGNKGTAVARVVWIDKTLPKATISYGITSLTNQNVVATISFDKENVTILNNGGNNTYTFTENGEFEFEFRGPAGNEGVARAEVNWIDKVVPKATIVYDIVEPTNKNVTATIKLDKENVKVENGTTHLFTENGEYTFKFEDEAGNMGTAKAVVSWIDKVVTPIEPSLEVDLTTSKATLNIGDEFEVNANIKNINNIEKGLIVLVGKFEYDKEKLEIVNIEGQNNWNLDENSYNDDNFRFVMDSNKFMIEEGTIFTVTLKVKETVKVPSEVVFKLSSVEGSNAEIDISAKDAELKLTINSETEDPLKFESDVYDIQESFISGVAPNTTVSGFMKLITTNRDIRFLKKKDDKIVELKDSDLVCTGTIVKIASDFEYTIIVMGDINGNGEAGLTDLARLKLHLIEESALTGIELRAADINMDGKVTLTDLAKIKLHNIGKEIITVK